MLAVLMFLGSADVIGRYVFDRPIQGTMGVSQLLLAGVVFFSWGYTQTVGGHIRVTLFMSRLSRRSQTVVNLLMSLVALAIFSIITWQGVVVALSYWHQGRYVDIINVPLFYFQLLVPLGGFVTSLVLITQILHLITEMRKSS